MGKYLLLALSVVLPAAAEFSKIEQTATYDVYRDGGQVVVLVDSKKRTEWRKVAESRGPERAVQSTFRSQLSGKDMFYFYLARTRMLDGEPVCEKFFRRPDDEAEQKLTLQIMALAPCG